MRVLFLHQNAPGQFRHLAPYLGSDPANEVVFLGERSHAVPGRVRWLRYPAPEPSGPATHHYLHRMEANVRRGQAVARACLGLRDQGFEPDVIVAHAGWGETMFLRDALPRAVIVSYCEMFYRSEGQDTGYIPETTLDLDGRCRLRAWNADLLTALDTMDRGIAPTAWQRAQHPECYQPRIAVVHDGVDTREVAPDRQARFTLPDGRTLTAGDEVVTFVARHLEPVRGFAALMRALPTLLRRRPSAQVVICGEDGVSYGRPPSDGANWRDVMLREVPIDPARVHFTGRLARREYLALLQVSALHLYLTVPFVLSWSCIEALAAGCLVLGSDVAPVREVLQDGVNGFLVDGRDPDAVAAQAAELLSRRASLGPVRDRARATAQQRFDVRQCLEMQSRIVREVASEDFGRHRGAVAGSRPIAGAAWPALRLEVTGPPVVAVAGARPGCDADDIPDTPARAIRLATGEVQLYASHFRNRVDSGPDLLHVTHRCPVVLSGADNDDPAAYNDRAWIASPWTPDGHTILAVVHNEFQGQRRPALCPTKRYMDCWYNALTAAVSHDGGHTFQRAPGRALVAALPYRFEELELGHHGYFNPSNIVTSGGAQYMMAFATKAGAQRDGNCLLRTTAVAAPEAWRGWDGSAFQAVFVNPYTQPGPPEPHTCAPVGQGGLRWPVTSLVRHAATGLFIATMQDGERGGGFYYSTSPDLLHWSAPALLLPAVGLGAWTCADPAPIVYPSLLDSGSTDRNFETVGAAPVLFATRFNVKDCRTGMDRELIRWAVRISAP